MAINAPPGSIYDAHMMLLYNTKQSILTFSRMQKSYIGAGCCAMVVVHWIIPANRVWSKTATTVKAPTSGYTSIL